ncbi:MAG TPA: hypothetical protein VHC22_07670 [Pirellulales bacterium]|nr:hypothetical protein [Pirellulales bacterium]
MIGRLLGAASVLFAAICVATVIAAAITLGYLRSHGKLDEKTIRKMIAVANGVDTTPSRSNRAADDAPAEQASLEDVARERALKSRDIELREQSLNDSVSMVKTEYAKLVDEKDRYERIKAAFRSQLDELRTGTLAENRETARTILENMKPKQAKEQVLRMVKEGEMTDVIKILSLMPSAKRGKIVGEFKTEEESQILANILKQIREGVPEINLADEAEKSLEQPDGAPAPDAATAP